MTIKRLPEVLTNDERRAFLKAFNPKCKTGLRNLCMVTIMANAGLRIAECLNLRPRDIDWKTGKGYVRQGKGKKDRVFHLSPLDLETLSAWYAVRPATSGEFLFVVLRGKTLGERLAERDVRRMVKFYAVEKAGIDKDVHPHTLRHTFGTDFYSKTRDLRLTQKAMGHAQSTTTEIYTHIADERLEDEMRGLRNDSQN